MRKDSYIINYSLPMLEWNDGLPLGNGVLGCVIYGNKDIRLSLDKISLWDERKTPVTTTKEFSFSNLIRLSKSGYETDWRERERIFEECYRNPYPTKIAPARLIIKPSAPIEKYQCSLHLYNAVAALKTSVLSMESFISALNNVGAVKIKGKFSLDIEMPKYLSSSEPDGLNYPKAIVEKDGNFLIATQKTKTNLEFTTIVYIKTIDDSTTELFYTIVTNEENEKYLENAREFLISMANQGYNGLKKNHVVWWKKYWIKSSCSTGDKLIDSVYLKCEYLFGSTSRKGSVPAPFQGVWTVDNDILPPWKGDYHFDKSPCLVYSSYLRSNHIDEGRVFIDYLWKNIKTYENFAKSFYQVKGLLIPGCSSLAGAPLGGWAQYSLSPTITIWVIKSFDDYYNFTNDKKFLEKRAYPMFFEVAEAIKQILEERDGKLYLPLSSSPEVFEVSRQAYLEPNSNFDLSLLIYLFKTLVRYCNILKLDPSEYLEILSKFDDLAIFNNVLLLDKTLFMPQSHRLMSHTFALYPLHLINYDDSPQSKEIYIRTNIDMERRGSGLWAGFSYPLASALFAMGKRGNAAFHKLTEFCKGFINVNGFHLNGDFHHYSFSDLGYSHFSVEGSFAFMDGVHQTLIQDFNGYIDLFPALCYDVTKAKFKNFRSIGNITISSSFINGQISELKIKSPDKKKIEIRFKEKAHVYELKQGLNNLDFTHLN